MSFSITLKSKPILKHGLPAGKFALIVKARIIAAYFNDPFQGL